jgi:hypothetical protein
LKYILEWAGFITKGVGISEKRVKTFVREEAAKFFRCILGDILGKSIKGIS